MSRLTITVRARLDAAARARGMCVPRMAHAPAARVLLGRGPAARAAGLSRALSLALCAALTVLVVAAALATPPAAHAAPFSIVVGDAPQATAVNPVTNKIYVANQLGNSVTVIDGATNATIPVTVGTNPCAVAVNPVTNNVYVANLGSGNVTVIDGATNTVTATVIVGTNPCALAVNPVTNKAYVASGGSANVTVIDEQLEQHIPLTVAITPLTGDRTSSATPTFTFSAETTFTPTAPAVMNVYYQVDTFQGTWLKATPDGAASSGATPALGIGLHILYAFASDCMTADSVQTGQQSAPLIGTIAAYVFLVDLPGPPSSYTIIPSAGSHGSITPARPSRSTPTPTTASPTCSSTAPPGGRSAATRSPA
jgi:YVTN family beta-propeller protein